MSKVPEKHVFEIWIEIPNRGARVRERIELFTAAEFYLICNGIGDTKYKPPVGSSAAKQFSELKACVRKGDTPARVKLGPSALAGVYAACANMLVTASVRAATLPLLNSEERQQVIYTMRAMQNVAHLMEVISGAILKRRSLIIIENFDAL